MPQLITTLGALEQHQLRTVLPHEHIFVDLSPITEDNWRKAVVSDVLPVMVPYLEEAKKVRCSKAICISPFKFRPEALEFALPRQIDLIGGDKLSKILKEIRG